LIPVTKPYLPPKRDYQKYVSDVWKRNWFTNSGPLVSDFELRLKKYLNLDHMLFVSNGTIAIQMAIKALGITKKVITTPFSYVATTSSLVWEGCTPVYADIDPLTFNIDPKKVEKLIDKDTEAILATHCFGNPCDIEGIDKVAKKHGLKVIYDAAHCFGTEFNGKSVFHYGDISTTSFHATKLFHTVEGGAVFTRDPDLLKRMFRFRNFGHAGPANFDGVGINAKNSELHAAMGLVNLQYADQILERRKKQYQLYDSLLKRLNKSSQKTVEKGNSNFSYYPVVLPSESSMLRMKKALESSEIYPRRYFYPSLSSLSYLSASQPTPISDDISSRILCLPIYHALTEAEQKLIARILLRTQKY